MTIEQLHSVYCGLSCRELPLEFTSYYERHLWQTWMQRGFTENDLEQVIRWIQRKIKKGERRPESLRLYNLLDPSRFLDDLIDSKATSRIKPETPKQEILKATQRPEQPCDSCRPAGEIVPNFKKLIEDMRKAAE